LVILCVVAALAVIEHGPAFWRGFVQGFADATRLPMRRELARTALGIIFTMMLTTLSLLFLLC
jgi:hypothetical protein